MAHLVYGAPYVPDDAQLSDLSVLMKHLLSVAAHMRGTTDGAGVARLLEAAAQALQQQSAEAKVQRGLAVASQTLASQLALKCEQVQQQQQSGGRGYAPHGGVQHSQGGGHMHSSGGGGHDGPSAITAAAVGTPGGGAARLGHVGAMPTVPGGIGARGEAAQLGSSTRQSHVRPPTSSAVVGLGDIAGMVGGYAGERGDEGDSPVEADRDSRRLGPRAFKTWVQEQPQPWAGSSGRAATMASAGSGSEAYEGEEGAVETMVGHLKQRFKQSGVTLPLEKASGST